jgi:hypothetical protein
MSDRAMSVTLHKDIRHEDIRDKDIKPTNLSSSIVISSDHIPMVPTRKLEQNLPLISTNNDAPSYYVVLSPRETRGVAGRVRVRVRVKSMLRIVYCL